MRSPVCWDPVGPEGPIGGPGQQRARLARGRRVDELGHVEGGHLWRGKGARGKGRKGDVSVLLRDGPRPLGGGGRLAGVWVLAAGRHWMKSTNRQALMVPCCSKTQVLRPAQPCALLPPSIQAASQDTYHPHQHAVASRSSSHTAVGRPCAPPPQQLLLHPIGLACRAREGCALPAAPMLTCNVYCSLSEGPRPM